MHVCRMPAAMMPMSVLDTVRYRMCFSIQFNSQSGRTFYSWTKGLSVELLQPLNHGSADRATKCWNKSQLLQSCDESSIGQLLGLPSLHDQPSCSCNMDLQTVTSKRTGAMKQLSNLQCPSSYDILISYSPAVVMYLTHGSAWYPLFSMTLRYRTCNVHMHCVIAQPPG